MTTDYIDLTGLEFEAAHGCLDFEKAEPQKFSVDLRLFLDMTNAAHSDSLADTVDYAAAADEVALVMLGPCRNLIEKLCCEICDRLLERFPALAAARVTVSKPNAPIGRLFRSVSATTQKKRSY